MPLHASQIVLAPVVSEKSYAASTRGKYTFKVHQDAHKTQIRQAVEQLFEVHVERVNVLKVQAKPKRRGAFKGTRPAGRRPSCSCAPATSSRSSRERSSRCRSAGSSPPAPAAAS